jgi:hypothetical protein
VIHTPRYPRTRAGLTLVEAVLSLLVLAVLATAALAAVSQAGKTRATVDEQSLGESLARGLLCEITALPYKEPASTIIGLDAGEVHATRSTLDDADDYNLFSETPCTTRDGTTIDGSDTWQRSVAVSWVPVSASTTATGTDTGLKRIWVTVRHNGRVVARLSALRGQTWDTMLTAGGL